VAPSGASSSLRESPGNYKKPLPGPLQADFHGNSTPDLNKPIKRGRASSREDFAMGQPHPGKPAAGFTLIEVLIVLIILMILAAVVKPQVAL
jgi:prepilin-type N-terminal cleavage/methylation domain-containing protein